MKRKIANKIKAGSINPLPIAPIVIVGANVNEKPNYMTVGFVNGVNIKPLTVCVSLNKNHHTPKGIIDNGTFSINIPSVNFVTETDYCGLVSGKGIDKSNIFTNYYGELKTAPMIEEFPITCECRYIDKKVEFAMDTVYFGEVHQVYINREVIKGNKEIDILKVNPLITGIDNLYRSVGRSVGEAYEIGWGYMSEEEFSDLYKCRLIEQKVQPALTICYQETMKNIQQIIGQAIFAINQYANKLGVKPSGAPYVVYHGLNKQNINMEIGIPFAKKIKGKDNIKESEIPGGKYASCIHVGPYNQLGAARAVLNQWMLENDYDSAGVSYEFYLNDPQKTPPDKLKTQILFPIN